MNREGKIHALLSTARIANGPSVVSNVWVGVVLGMLRSNIPAGQELWQPAVWLALAGVMLYIGGNFLNDWMDRKWDALHRPERALPRGLFPHWLYAALAVVLMGTGVGIACWMNSKSGMVAAGIVFWIVIYTFWHKLSPWAVIPMGICRALLPVMGSMALFPYLDSVWPLACGLLTYIMGLSLSARYESMAAPPKSVGVMSRGLLLMTALLVAWGNKDFPLGQLLSVAGALPYLAWTAFSLRFRNKPVPVLVSCLLAGIPLVDWMVLLPVGVRLVINSGGAWSGLAISCVIVPPLAFVFAKLLQKVAPAT